MEVLYEIFFRDWRLVLATVHRPFDRWYAALLKAETPPADAAERWFNPYLIMIREAIPCL
jgi:hypothetical protein